MKNAIANKRRVWKQLRHICVLIWKIDRKLSRECNTSTRNYLLLIRGRLKKIRVIESNMYKMLVINYRSQLQIDRRNV